MYIISFVVQKHNQGVLHIIDPGFADSLVPPQQGLPWGAKGCL